MATSMTSVSYADAALSRRQLTRALLASTVGSTIEWYDYTIYAVAASVFFSRLFFPSVDPVAGTLAAFATFFVGYAVRPIGAAFFGHFGDRIGRKATLIVTLLLMGVATFLMGLLPTYADIGIWAALLLVLLRICQGMAVAGEWSGAVLLTVEWGNARRRGFLGAWPVAGVAAGQALGAAAFQVSISLLGPGSYWGWRVPFLISIVLVLVGLYIRLGVLETPVFAKLLEERKTEPVPLASLLRNDLRQVVLLVFMLAGVLVMGLIAATFTLTYTIQYLHQPQGQIFTFQLLTSVLGVFAYLLFGHLSDVIGRKRMYVIGVITLMLYAFPYFLLLDSRQPLLIFIAIALSFPIVAMQLSPLGAIVAEAFTGRWRYSGAALSYHVGSILFGGTAPTVAFLLLTAFRSTTPIAIYLVAASLVSLVAALTISDGSRRDLGVEYDERSPVRRATGLQRP